MSITAAIPEKLHSYKVYNEGERLIGLQAEVQLPKLEAMTSTISGPGILGEIESPNIGHFSAGTLDTVFRTFSEQASKLAGPGPHTLTFRADQQSYDSAGGTIQHRPLKVVVRGFNNAFDPGKLNAGNPTETTLTLGVFYIKIELASGTGKNSTVLLELDKYNEIYTVGGVDYLAEVRANT